LSLEPASVSFGYFPHYLVEVPKLISFSKGGRVASAHADASPVNLQCLTAFLSKWVVHIRDPRSVVLSWVHHMNRLYAERDNGEYQHLFVYPSPPMTYFQLQLRKQIDWNIENFLPGVLRWTRSWLAVHDSRRYDILLTNYSELARDELGHVHKILDFYGVPRELFRRPQVEKTLSGSHFRPGSEVEWASVFTRDQIFRATQLVGEDLLERFGWLRPQTIMAA
jgi:hypothetical protein